MIMINKIAEKNFDTRATLATALANDVANHLRNKIEINDKANIAVSGGSTPKLFFTELSRQTLPWEKITIILVDERYVAPDNPRSNEKLVRNYLITNAAVTANFIGFWQDNKTISQVENTFNNIMDEQIRNLDVVILGMGLDGHTASFFPGGNNLVKAMNSSYSKAVIQMQAPDAKEPRLTLTLPMLINADHLILHIEGEDKREVLARTQARNGQESAPIRTLIDELNSPINLYWAP